MEVCLSVKILLFTFSVNVVYALPLPQGQDPSNGVPPGLILDIPYVPEFNVPNESTNEVISSENNKQHNYQPTTILLQPINFPPVMKVSKCTTYTIMIPKEHEQPNEDNETNAGLLQSDNK